MIRGALVLLDSLRLLLVERTLRSVLWRMLGLLVLLGMLLAAGVFWLSDYLVHLWIPSGDAWYWQLLGAFAWLLAFVLALVSGAVGFVTLASVAASPWLDMLAVRTERLLGLTVGEPSASWTSQIMQSLINSVRPLFGLLGLGVVAVACMVIPVIGQLAATVIWGYAGVRFLNFELLDVPASRRQWDFSQRRDALKNERLFHLGFGGMAMLLMLVPVVNVIVLPAAVVALSRHYAGR
jgi:CysZ protein